MVFGDALMRLAQSHPRLRLAVEVVPPNDGFVPDPRFGAPHSTVTCARLATMIGIGTAESSARRFAGGVSLRQCPGILWLFCICAAPSPILSAYSSSTATPPLTTWPY